jgi:hypothetical protein
MTHVEERIHYYTIQKRKHAFANVASSSSTKMVRPAGISARNDETISSLTGVSADKHAGICLY